MPVGTQANVKGLSERDLAANPGADEHTTAGAKATFWDQWRIFAASASTAARPMITIPTLACYGVAVPLK